MDDARATRAHAPASEEDAPEAERVEELLRMLASTIRSYRLYAGHGPTVERFVATLRTRLDSMWGVRQRLRLEISESSIWWEGQKVFPTGESGSELAFLFYKDGIRSVTLLPGLEAELPGLLSVLGRAPQIREEEDDLVTLLWQENLSALIYESVDLPVEGTDIGSGSGEPPRPADPQAVREAAAPTAAAPGLGAEDFREALYFLDEAELRSLDQEVRLEVSRDLWRDVLSALLDRFEDGSEERQIRIVALFEEVLPSMLAAGAYERAGGLLEELSRLVTRGPLPVSVLQRIQGVHSQLASAEVLEQLLQLLDEPSSTAGGESLARLLAFFPPTSLAPLTRLLDSVARPDSRRLLAAATERLAAENRDEVARLLSDPDPVVIRGALRWVGSLAIGSAAVEVMRLLGHESPAVRLAAVEAVVGLRAAVAGPELIRLLHDPDRDVRLTTARALGALEHAAARPELEAAIEGKRLRAADRTEKLTFFEALGRLGGAEAVPFLDRLLNTRGWLGRGESSEIRACAALGLARVRHPSAREALEKAFSDTDPVVRTAVGRALRGAEGA